MFYNCRPGKKPLLNGLYINMKKVFIDHPHVHFRNFFRLGVNLTLLIAINPDVRLQKLVHHFSDCVIFYLQFVLNLDACPTHPAVAAAGIICPPENIITYVVAVKSIFYYFFTCYVRTVVIKSLAIPQSPTTNLNIFKPYYIYIKILRELFYLSQVQKNFTYCSENLINRSCSWRKV